MSQLLLVCTTALIILFCILGAFACLKGSESRKIFVIIFLSNSVLFVLNLWDKINKDIFMLLIDLFIVCFVLLMLLFRHKKQ